MRPLLALAASLLAACASTPPASRDSPTAEHVLDCSSSWARGPARVETPFTYRDEGTGILLYVESDGRHVAAFDPTGKLLWVSDPYLQAGFCPYRTSRPIIYSIAPAEDYFAWRFRMEYGPGPYLEITFDSSQFGDIDLSNGNFHGIGQN
jgi:hypothetical protein